MLKLFIIQFSVARESYFTLNAAILLRYGNGLYSRGSITGRRNRFFSTPRRTNMPDAPSQPHVRWPQRAVSLGVKWLAPEADNSPPSNTEVENG
jgi:hypothetical protein